MRKMLTMSRKMLSAEEMYSSGEVWKRLPAIISCRS